MGRRGRASEGGGVAGTKGEGGRDGQGEDRQEVLARSEGRGARGEGRGRKVVTGAFPCPHFGEKIEPGSSCVENGIHEKSGEIEWRVLLMG